MIFTVTKKGDTIAAKKRYAKRTKIIFNQDRPIKMDKIEVKGFKKSNMSEVGNKIISKIMSIICSDEANESVRNDVLSYLKEEIMNIKNGKYELYQICKRVALSKYIDEYANEEHVRAARWTNENAYKWEGVSTYNKGSLVKYIYIKDKHINRKYSRSNVIALDNNDYLPDDVLYMTVNGKKVNIIDMDMIIEKTILEPLSEILDGLNLSIDEILGRKTQQKMF